MLVQFSRLLLLIFGHATAVAEIPTPEIKLFEFRAK